MYNVPPNLKLSHVTMIPHKSRAFHGILDTYSQLRHSNKAFKSFNENITTSNHQSMAQFGSTLQRIIATVADRAKPNSR